MSSIRKASLPSCSNSRVDGESQEWNNGFEYHENDQRRPDTLHEGGNSSLVFVYFFAPDGQDTLNLDSLTLLWYGMRMFEMPIFLNSDPSMLT